MDRIALILMNVRTHKHVEEESALTLMEGMSANAQRILSYCNQVLLIVLYCLYFIVCYCIFPFLYTLCIYFSGTGCIDLRTGNCYMEYNTSRNGLPVCGGDITSVAGKTNGFNRGSYRL